MRRVRRLTTSRVWTSWNEPRAARRSQPVTLLGRCGSRRCTHVAPSAACCCASTTYTSGEAVLGEQAQPPHPPRTRGRPRVRLGADGGVGPVRERLLV